MYRSIASISVFHLALLSIGVVSSEAFFRPIKKSTSHPHSFLHNIRCGALEDTANDVDQVEGEESSSQDVSRTMYNKQATNWVRTEPRCLSDFTGRPVVFGMLAEELQGADKIVLDVGCGEGYCARKVIELGAAKVVGCDISQEMINSARTTSEGDDRFQFYASDVGNLLQGLEDHKGEVGIDGSTGTFDVAIAVFLFNYLTSFDMEEAIVQIYQALKPGGIFVFSVPHPSMIFCHDKDSVFHLNSEGKGYYSSRNEKILGQISTIDGTKLNVMSVHKTVGDYIHAINDAGFQIVDIQEAGVTEEHLALHPEFFQSVQDRPLHLVFKLKKP
mmetsp:Transcript_29736/g.50615  ORF Transcript_29736/g.50615 Transcript_29736/m.50615 type:complete len:331 (-) Transcript_29736:935-1927(-)|eukprot:CAMPEP_0183776916 /NCGR_PEP_ID=MMETSP0739-20130205/47886_1 /TAXON_ID=385413 /ORGANISM="Thalassiosira miniscula, Strain CCMP1093" /LENGTH=330 /DNA_ID=CAMNT_0026018899 /DNA_START=65 /DNA_END=1057 /DNA_ORIENTATION=+